VIFVGYTIFGATGFGASPITIPVLAHVLPLTLVLSLAALLDLGSGLALGFHTRRQADTRELLTLMPFTLVGLTLGVTLLVKLSRSATVLALGLFVCVYALHVMFRREPARRLNRWWAAPAGVLGGIVGALFGMGGPPYVMYISGHHLHTVLPLHEQAPVGDLVSTLVDGIVGEDGLRLELQQVFAQLLGVQTARLTCGLDEELAAGVRTCGVKARRVVELF
jgi:hypothetical protein